MRKRNRRFTDTLLGLALLGGAGCTPDAPVLTLEGAYTGTTSSTCQMALRTEAGELVESHGVPSSFRQDYAVATGKGRYRVELVCPDGKVGSSPSFDFEPPRGTVKLRDIELN